MTIPEVAQELATSDCQIRALIKAVDLPAIQIGGRGHWRIERSKLEKYIAGAYTSAAEAIQRGIELTDENEE